jgi:hypothetical protein
MAGVIACGLLSASCNRSSSPTAPSAVVSVAPDLPPANVAGTWDNDGGAFMTINQTGTMVTGIQLPATIEVSGMSTVTMGTVTGSVSGDHVSLQLQDTVTIRRRGDTVICRGGDSFSGQVSGELLTGILISGTTRYICDGGMSLPTPQISGPIVFTRRR